MRRSKGAGRENRSRFIRPQGREEGESCIQTRDQCLGRVCAQELCWAMPGSLHWQSRGLSMLWEGRCPGFGLRFPKTLLLTVCSGSCSLRVDCEAPESTQCSLEGTQPSGQTKLVSRHVAICSVSAAWAVTSTARTCSSQESSAAVTPKDTLSHNPIPWGQGTGPHSLLPSSSLSGLQPEAIQLAEGGIVPP